MTVEILHGFTDEASGDDLPAGEVGVWLKKPGVEHGDPEAGSRGRGGMHPRGLQAPGELRGVGKRRGNRDFTQTFLRCDSQQAVRPVVPTVAITSHVLPAG
jgi:hypothetical protein